MMPRRKPLNDVIIANAYAKHVIDGGLSPLTYLTSYGKSAVNKAIASAVLSGVIGMSGDPLRGWLTERGVALLEAGARERYGAAVKAKARITS